jgi:hypothetical protein
MVRSSAWRSSPQFYYCTTLTGFTLRLMPQFFQGPGGPPEVTYIDVLNNDAAGKLASGKAKAGTSLSLALSPNPASSNTSLTIESMSNTDVTISIMNLLGQEVFRSFNVQIRSGESTIPLPIDALPSGSYVVRVDQLGSQPKSVMLSKSH